MRLLSCCRAWPRLWRVAVAALGASMPLAAHALPSFDTVRDSWRSSDWVLLSRTGKPLQRTRVDLSERRGDWIALADISPALREAIVVSEDQRFYMHSGVDWRGIAGAAWANLWNTRTRGASTVTMQLASLLADAPRRAGRRSLPQKAVQAGRALWLEQSWRKDQILEAYLNLVPFRGETVGLTALSRTLFGKAPSGLDEREAAIAAALIRAPNAASPKVTARACRILRDMRASASCVNLDGFTQLALAGVSSRSAVMASDDADALAPHFAQRIATRLRPPAGARVRSSLDAALQRFARDTLTRTLLELNAPAHPRNARDGAVIVLDNASGEILAWVGSSGALSGAREVDAVLAPRQAGSTLKPFLYAQALDEKRLTSVSLLDDAPVNLTADGGLYIPQNYDRNFKGWVSVRTALGASLNVPAVRTLVLVTPHRFARTLLRLGLPLAQEGDYYGYSLALGSADIPLLALTNAYRALANGGVTKPTLDLPSPSLAAAHGERVFSPAASFIVTDMLADNNARIRTFGFDSPLATRFFSAVKTGTSKDMRDNWAIGFTSRYTVGVWIGNADGAPMWDVSGVTGAAPVWAAMVDYLHRNVRSVRPAPPAGVARMRVTFDRAVEPARDEWFIRGTEMTSVQLAANAASAHVAAPIPLTIRAPANGTIFALDPDIPPTRQRIWFERTSPSSSAGRVAWRLDGRLLGHSARFAWPPWPGRHVLELTNAQGRTLDQVKFEVRGASIKPSRQRAPATGGH